MSAHLDNEELRALTLKRMAERNIPQGLGPRVCGQLHPDDGETACTRQPGHTGEHQARGADTTICWLTRPFPPPPMRFFGVASGGSASINSAEFYVCLICHACVIEVHNSRDQARQHHAAWHEQMAATSTNPPEPS